MKDDIASDINDGMQTRRVVYIQVLLCNYALNDKCSSTISRKDNLEVINVSISNLIDKIVLLLRFLTKYFSARF